MLKSVCVEIWSAELGHLVQGLWELVEAGSGAAEPEVLIEEHLRLEENKKG